MPKVMINPGHGPGNTNKGPTGYYEHQGMWALANYLKAALESRGIQADLTRRESENPDVEERGLKAAGYDVYISEHSNAANGQARGCEVYYSLRRQGDKVWAAKLSAAAAEAMGNPDRGAKTRLFPGTENIDYYGEIRSAANTGCRHIFLCESGFHDNPQDEAWLKSELNLIKLAQAQANVIMEMLAASDAAGTPILGAPQVATAQMQAWARKRNAHQRFIDIAPTYAKYGLLTGIRPEVLYAQSAKETAFGRYGGAVTPEMNNWAGIKIDKPTGDKTSDHQSFPTPDDGVRGHFNHIAAYVGLEPIGTPHPRYYVVKGMPWAGTVRTVEELGAKWAPNAKYGESIVNDYLKDLLATPEPEEDELAELKKELEYAQARIASLESEKKRLLEDINSLAAPVAVINMILQKHSG